VPAYLASQLTSNVSPEELAEATGKNVRTNPEVQTAIKDIQAKPRTSAPIYRRVNGEVKQVGTRYLPAKSAIELAPPQSTLGRMGDAITKVAPGLKPAGEFVKGALPTLGMVGKYAGIGGLLGDVGARAYGGDTTGAAISGAGGALGMMLAPQIGIPVGLGAAGINYLRDNPEIMDRLSKYYSEAAEGEYPIPR
jgi:hypothetical protein